MFRFVTDIASLPRNCLWLLQYNTYVLEMEMGRPESLFSAWQNVFLSAPHHFPSSQATRHSSSPSPCVVTRFGRAAHQQTRPQLCHANFFFTSYLGWIWNRALDSIDLVCIYYFMFYQASRHLNYESAIIGGSIEIIWILTSLLMI